MRLDGRILSSVLLLQAAVLLCLSAQCRAATIDQKIADVRMLLAQIGSEPDNNKRYALADQLTKDVYGMNRSERDAFAPEVVDQIATFLNDDDELVRAFAANVLGQIGTPALRAVGALLKALREAERGSRKEYRNTDANAMDSIVAALVGLKVCVVPDEKYSRSSCDYLIK